MADLQSQLVSYVEALSAYAPKISPLIISSRARVQAHLSESDFQVATATLEKAKSCSVCGQSKETLQLAVTWSLDVDAMALVYNKAQAFCPLCFDLTDLLAMVSRLSSITEDEKTEELVQHFLKTNRHGGSRSAQARSLVSECYSIAYVMHCLLRQQPITFLLQDKEPLDSQSLCKAITKDFSAPKVNNKTGKGQKKNKIPKN